MILILKPSGGISFAFSFFSDEAPFLKKKPLSMLFTVLLPGISSEGSVSLLSVLGFIPDIILLNEVLRARDGLDALLATLSTKINIK